MPPYSDKQNRIFYVPNKIDFTTLSLLKICYVVNIIRLQSI